MQDFAEASILAKHYHKVSFIRNFVNLNFDVKIMKFFRNFALFIIFATLPMSCKKENKDLWKVDVTKQQEAVEITDISKELYDPKVSLEQFKKDYPFFQGTVSDEEFSKRRVDSEEITVYKEALAKIDQAKLQKDLTSLFAHIRYYFPDFKNPKVYLYSSALQGIMDPIFYRKDFNMLFIDISAFMGTNDLNYKGLEMYLQNSMSPAYMVPKVSMVFAENYVPYEQTHQKFIDQIIYQGKLMTLQDAFMPDMPDYLKINYTPEQLQWAKDNEANIWNYFVEGNLVFSDDQRLNERFLTVGPFSKFYTEIDNESSPQIGVWTGWQICRKFFQEKPQTKMADFLKMNATEIFNQAEYKPKKN